MQGKRAPELAVGKLQSVLAEMYRIQLWRFINAGNDDLLEPLSAQELQALNDELQLAKAHVEAQLNIKMDFWNRLHWSLIGLAHACEADARAAAAICVEMFDRAPLR